MIADGYIAEIDEVDEISELGSDGEIAAISCH